MCKRFLNRGLVPVAADVQFRIEENFPEDDEQQKISMRS